MAHADGLKQQILHSFSASGFSSSTGRWEGSPRRCRGRAAWAGVTLGNDRSLQVLVKQNIQSCTHNMPFYYCKHILLLLTCHFTTPNMFYYSYHSILLLLTYYFTTPKHAILLSFYYSIVHLPLHGTFFGKNRGRWSRGCASPADALSWRYLASARWVALQLGDDVFHTSINMSRPPLCAMQVLGNELLRRPDLLVVLQRIEELELVTLYWNYFSKRLTKG